MLGVRADHASLPESPAQPPPQPPAASTVPAALDRAADRQSLGPEVRGLGSAGRKPLTAGLLASLRSSSLSSQVRTACGWSCMCP